MISRGIALSAALIMGAGCSGNQSEVANTDTTPSNVEVQVSDPVDHAGPIRDGLKLFSDTYGCPVEVNVSVAEIPNDDFGGQGGKYTIAISNDPGAITVNNNLPPAYDSMVENREVDPVRIGVHESTHACQAANTTLLEKPIEVITQNITIHFVAVQGLTLITDQRTPNGNGFTKFSNVEEGAAEVAATELRGSTSTNPEYARYEQITRSLMANSGMSSKELMQYVQTNNLIGFLAKVSGIPQPSSADVLDLVRLYE